MAGDVSASARRAPALLRHAPALLVLLALAPARVAASPAPVKVPEELGPVPLKAGAPAAALDMKARAEAWFSEKTDAATRRAEMRAITAALKQPCRYCHTPAFDDYTDRLAISRQMMALSAEHAVPCADCHQGKSDYTELGRKSVQMWQLSVEQGVLCEHCHVPKKRFEVLTNAGETFKKGPWPAWRAAHPVPAVAPSGPSPSAP
jgi:hypothetical protein